MNKMMKYLMIAALSILGVIGTFIFLNILFNSDFSYIEKATGVSLPDGVSDVDTYDNGEHYIVAHVGIPQADLDNFIKENNFEKYPYTAGQGFFGIERLEVAYQKIPESKALYWLNGRSETNRWQYLVDKISGNLWIVVFYPDFAGDV